MIENFYAVCSILTLLMTTAFVNSAASREFACNMNQIVFATPLKKFDYLRGTVPGIGAGCRNPAARRFSGNSAGQVHAVGRCRALGVGGLDGAPESHPGVCHSQHAVHRGDHFRDRGADPQHGHFVYRWIGIAGGVRQSRRR